MRILGFSRKDWINYLTGRPKLQEPEVTTFRMTRRDRDWAVRELVQVVYKPRRKGGGEKLGIAEIISKEPTWINQITVEEAQRDGFPSYKAMCIWLYKAHGERCFREPINKLTIRWVNGKATT